MLAWVFKELDRVHACPAVATPHKREDWTHQPGGAVVTDTYDRKLDDEESVMPLLIYLE